MKIKDIQPTQPYTARLSFTIGGEIKNFPDEKQLKEFIITIQVLQEMLALGRKRKRERKGRRRRRRRRKED